MSQHKVLLALGQTISHEFQDLESGTKILENLFITAGFLKLPMNNLEILDFL